LIDLVIAAAITLFTGYTTLVNALAPADETVVVLWLVACAVGVPLVARRQWPMLVFSIVLIAAIVATLLSMPVTATMLAVAAGLYAVSVSVRPRRSAAALGAAVLGATVALVVTHTVWYPHFLVVAPQTDLVSSLAFSWFTVGLGWALGRRLRARREHDSQIAEHHARQAVSEERLRIAREMHDIVGHSLGVIVMKAAVANHVYNTRPEESREALGVIESVGRAALADIQRVLSSLRSADEIDLAPSPGLDELPKLVETARLANVQVELERGPVPALPAAVQLPPIESCKRH
jgi:signal transduction histidine kinase